MTETDDGSRSWKLYAKIGLAFAIALALLVPMPALMQDPGTSHGWFALVGLGMGGLFLVGGWKGYKRAQLVRDTPTSKVRSLAVGVAEVKGEAEPVGEPLVSPLTHREACMYSLHVERHDPDDEGSDWDTVLRLSDQVPFRVDDGTGKARVEPQGADLEIEVEAEVRVDDGEEPPAALGEWAEAEGMVDAADPPDREGAGGWLEDRVDSLSAGRAEAHLVRSDARDRRYRERVLGVGESAYVFGGARRREDADAAENERNLVLREHAGTGRFLVSDKSEPELLADTLVGAGIAIAVALLLLAYGSVAALFWLGLL